MDALDALIKTASPEIIFEACHAFEGEYSYTRKRHTNSSCSLIFVLDGGCGVLSADEEIVWLSAGDFLIINNNDEYRLVSAGVEYEDQAAFGAVGLEETQLMGRHRVGSSKVLCAAVASASGASSVFFKMLPARLMLPSSVISPQSPFIRIVNMLRSETDESGGGSRPVMESFAKCGLVLALREITLLDYPRCGLLSLCRHPTLNRYLCSLVEDPRRGWSLNTSVGLVHKFSERDVMDVSGFTATAILTALRVLMSFPLLTASKKTILQIGVMVGYNSAAEFSRSFIDCVGGPPENYRISGVNSSCS